MRDWKQAASRWNGGGHGATFQHAHWLDAWYGAFDTVSPLIVVISDAATQQDIALVPLVRRVQNGIRLVEFTDLGLTDYNAPILGPAAPDDAAGTRLLCQALVTALRRLPDGADLIRMQKMPAEIDGKPNPLVLLGRIGSCSLNGNLIETGDDFELYRSSIKRMQLPRSWRVFSRYPGAAFRIVTNIDEALAVLDTTDAQQQARMQSLGLEFNLNNGACAGFYRKLVTRGVKDGYVIVSALRCDEGVMATSLGIRQQRILSFCASATREDAGRIVRPAGSSSSGRWPPCTSKASGSSI